MKMTTEHYNYLKTEMGKVYYPIADYRKALIEEGRAKDVEMRLRWDVMYATVNSKWVCDSLYPYLNDDHIDTALRSIIKEMEKV